MEYTILYSYRDCKGVLLAIASRSDATLSSYLQGNDPDLGVELFGV